MDMLKRSLQNMHEDGRGCVFWEKMVLRYYPKNGDLSHITCPPNRGKSKERLERSEDVLEEILEGVKKGSTKEV